MTFVRFCVILCYFKIYFEGFCTFLLWNFAILRVSLYDLLWFCVFSCDFIWCLLRCGFVLSGGDFAVILCLFSPRFCLISSGFCWDYVWFLCYVVWFCAVLCGFVRLVVFFFIVWSLTANVIKISRKWPVNPSSSRRLCAADFPTLGIVFTPETHNCTNGMMVRGISRVVFSPSTLSPLPGACMPATADTHAQPCMSYYWCTWYFLHTLCGTQKWRIADLVNHCVNLQGHCAEAAPIMSLTPSTSFFVSDRNSNGSVRSAGFLFFAKLSIFSSGGKQAVPGVA